MQSCHLIDNGKIIIDGVEFPVMCESPWIFFRRTPDELILL